MTTTDDPEVEASGAPDDTRIPEEDRVPLKQKFAYAMGLVADHYATYGLNQLALPVYNILLGLSPSLVSTALAISRLWDAITDPLVGSFSDNLKSRFGRRKPLLFIGAVLTGCFFPIVWLAPEAWSDRATFAYLCAAFLIFYTFYSIMSVPYESLGMELTPNYLERTNVYSTRAYFASVLTLGIPYLFWLGNLDVFRDPLSGVRAVSVGVGILIIGAGILPAKMCVERYKSVADHQTSENAIHSIASLFKNGPFVVLVNAITLFLLAITSVQALDPYIHIYYIYGGDIKTGAFLNAANQTFPIAFALLGAFCVQRMSRRYDKRHLLLACVAILFLGKLSLFITYLPGKPLLTLTAKPFLAFASSGFWVLVISMRADVADWDEYKVGRRREGMIAAINNWMVKVAFTIAIASSGYILQFVAGFDIELEGEQSMETLRRLKLAYVAIPSVATAIVFVLLTRYSLTREKLRDVRAELEKRRNAV